MTPILRIRIGVPIDRFGTESLRSAYVVAYWRDDRGRLMESGRAFVFDAGDRPALIRGRLRLCAEQVWRAACGLERRR